MQPHHWPQRHFIRIADDIGVSIETADHNEQSEPLYTFYVSKTPETKTLTEAMEEIPRSRIRIGGCTSEAPKQMK